MHAIPSFLANQIFILFIYLIFFRAAIYVGIVELEKQQTQKCGQRPGYLHKVVNTNLVSPLLKIP